MTDSIEMVPWDDEHDRAVLDLLADALRWGLDQRHAALFAWKHRENPFGRSPGWVALDGGRVVAFRAFLRWEFDRPGGTVRAVRAVDTATAPDYQGRGLFTRLTRHGLTELRAEGVRFVFNTPNDNSRPGYLKMGWSVVGRPSVAMRPTSIGALAAVARARQPASRWPEASSCGLAAGVALADGEGLAALLASQPPATGLRTRRTAAFLTWRYPDRLLGYRALLAGDDIGEGIALFRVRRRGAAREAALCELIVPAGEPARARDLARRLVRSVDAHYVLLLAGPGSRPLGFVPMPGQGPTLAWRGVIEAEAPPLDGWDLSLGDVELF